MLQEMPYRHTLTDEEKRELLRIARATLREYTRTGRIPPGRPHRSSLLAEAGAFVTLRVGGNLRGCIGTQAEDSPLYRTVQEMAVAAASRDPRFSPVTSEEVEDLTIEVSVLGGRERIDTAEQIEIGVHGIAVAHDGRRGLLLPQVASENEWDSETFLARACVKAGLPADHWRNPATEVERFTAQVFDETSHPPPSLWN
jgi:AmmeMemoRadiSam system protein A